jgi:hypothetical protein
VEIWFSIFPLLFSEHFAVFLCAIWSLSTDKDWEDIKFGVDNQVDFYAVSFVKDAEVVHELKDYLKSKVFSSL